MSDTQEFRFSTGVVATLRPVSPFLRQRVYRSLPEPQPPLVDVDYGDGEARQEPNPNDPDYHAALREHELQIGIRLRDTLLQFGVDVAIDAQRKAAVIEMLESVGSAWPDDEPEHVAYIKLCCVGSEAELNVLLQEIIALGNVTEQEVAAAVQMFRSHAQPS